MVLNQRTILKMLEEGRDPFKEEEESIAKIAAAAEAAALKRSNLKMKKQINRSSNSNEDSRECGTLLKQDDKQHDGLHSELLDLSSAVKVSTSIPDETITVKGTEKTKRSDSQKSSSATVSKKVSKKVSKSGTDLSDFVVRKDDDAVIEGCTQEIMEAATTSQPANVRTGMMMNTEADARSDTRRLVDISTSSADDQCVTAAVSNAKKIILDTGDSDADKQRSDSCVRNGDRRNLNASNDSNNYGKNGDDNNNSNNYCRNSDDIKYENLKCNKSSMQNDSEEKYSENLKDKISDELNKIEEVEEQLVPSDPRKSSIGKIKKRKKEEEEDISNAISSDLVFANPISERIDILNNIVNVTISTTRPVFSQSTSSSSTTSSFPSSTSSSNFLPPSVPNVPSTIKPIATSSTSSTSSTTFTPMSSSSAGGKIMKNKSTSQLSVPIVTGIPVWVSQLTRRIHANEVNIYLGIFQKSSLSLL